MRGYQLSAGYAAELAAAQSAFEEQFIRKLP
jgi:hypothetical protein